MPTEAAAMISDGCTEHSQVNTALPPLRCTLIYHFVILTLQMAVQDVSQPEEQQHVLLSHMSCSSCITCFSDSYDCLQKAVGIKGPVRSSSGVRFCRIRHGI